MTFSQLKEKTKSAPFSKRVYRVCIIPDQIMALTIFVVSTYVTGIKNISYLPFLCIYIFISLLTEFSFGPFINKIISTKLGREIDYWKVSVTSPKDRAELIQSLMKFPGIKTLEVYIFFLICSLILTLLVKTQTAETSSDMLTFLISSFLLSYASGVITHYNVENICSEIAIKIAKQGIDGETVRSKKFFGLPLSVLFILYIIVPVITCSFFMFAVCLKNYNGSSTDFDKIIFCALFNIAMISLFTILYFRKINKYTKLMEIALASITKENIHNVTDLFPVDFSNHISYSFYLINTTVKLFQNLLKNYSSINRKIEQICQDLYSVSNQTQATIVQQTASVEEISATVKSTNNLTGIVEKKVDEVINIASKTLESANENSNALDRNIGKIIEITRENKKTISSIQGLSNKINSVWDIVNIIDSVADQTKIIAFNAELEAGLLYEKNDSLNSVSMEIRNLANKTNELTKEIRDQISGIQFSSDRLIELGKSCMQKIDDANECTEELQLRFKAIKEFATTTSEDAEKIRYSIYEQSKSMKEIENTLAEINLGAKDFSETTRGISHIIAILQQNCAYIKNINDAYGVTVQENKE